MKTLLYPSAGNEDWKKALEQFLDSMDKFIFADLNYSEANLKNFKIHIAGLGIIEKEEATGSFSNLVTSVVDGKNRYCDIEPVYYNLHLRIKDELKIIIFRKGFGQYALYELENSSLDVFYHRGDSQGESGSNVFYLANRNAKHMPISKLFNTLISKLKDQALIVSDGSNTDFQKLNKTYKKIKDLKKEDVLENIENTEVRISNIVLKCIDALDYRYNHTLIWQVIKK